MASDLVCSAVTVTHPGGTRGLAGLNLEVQPGELVAVIGPSGSGKTTLLRAIAGLVEVDSGEVLLGGASLDGVSPAQRPTAMVFQGNTLFPDLTVRDNVRAGLAGVGPREEEAIDVALLQFGLMGVQHRLPHQLSGGEQRRTALARAIVLRPEVLLLDEPLSGLDDALRSRLVATVRETQRRFEITTLYVTHRQGEALSTADRIAVLRGGRIEQLATPEGIYTRPATLFVASFIGRSNLLEVEVREVRDGRAGLRLFGRDHLVPAHADVEVGRAILLVRPEDVVLNAHEESRSWTEVRDEVGLVSDEWYFGSRRDHLVETESGMVSVTTRAQHAMPAGASVRVEIDASRAWALPAK